LELIQSTLSLTLQPLLQHHKYPQSSIHIELNSDLNSKIEPDYYTYFSSQINISHSDLEEDYYIIKFEIGLKPMDIYGVGEVVGELKTMLIGLIPISYIKGVHVNVILNDDRYSSKTNIGVNLLIKKTNAQIFGFFPMMNELIIKNFSFDLDIFNKIPDTYSVKKIENDLDNIDVQEYIRFKLKLKTEVENVEMLRNIVKDFISPSLLPVITLMDKVDLSMHGKTPEEFIQNPNLENEYFTHVYKYAGTFNSIRLFFAVILQSAYPVNDNSTPMMSLYQQLVDKFSSINRLTLARKKMTKLL